MLLMLANVSVVRFLGVATGADVSLACTVEKKIDLFSFTGIYGCLWLAICSPLGYGKKGANFEMFERTHSIVIVFCSLFPRSSNCRSCLISLHS